MGVSSNKSCSGLRLVRFVLDTVDKSYIKKYLLLKNRLDMYKYKKVGLVLLVWASFKGLKMDYEPV